MASENSTTPVFKDAAKIRKDFLVVARDYTARFNAARAMNQVGTVTRATITLPGEKRPAQITPEMVSDLATELAEVSVSVNESMADANESIIALADLLGAHRYYLSEYAKACLPGQRQTLEDRGKRIDARAAALRGHYRFAAK